MKKPIFMIAILIMLSSYNMYAQWGSLGERIADGLSNKAQNKIENEVDNASEKAYNKSKDAAVNGVKNDKSSSKNASNSSTSSSTDNTNSAAKNEDNGNSNSSNNNPSSSNSPLLKSYAKFDFVPGTTILFEDNFVNESTDEIPSLWIPSAGTVEIAQFQGKNVMGFLDGGDCKVRPRMKTPCGYLPARFTVEFDYFLTNNGQPNKDCGGALDINFGAYSDCNSEGLGDLQNFINLYCDGSVVFNNFSGTYNTPDDMLGWRHYSIAVTEKSLKVYVNQQRVLNAPINSGAAQLVQFSQSGFGKDAWNGFFRNVRIAAGGTDPYKQLTAESKFIARGINFDYNKATIKPESMGELNRIVTMMNQHPELKFEIGGHTDADGDAAYNLKLSQQRADAVKAQLISMGIDASKLTSKGYGKTKPIADNSTDEGKANNRRVEFVKL
jgi:outer membrane protein OmpA-like peptidoglycan-associated protein